MSQSVGDVLLVGSVPLDSAEDVFKTCAASLGDHLKVYPDGEVGARKSWIQCQAKLVFDRHPAIDTVKRPRLEDGFSREYDDNWAFRLRSGTEAIQFDDLKYSGWAVESYATFNSLRARGVIPPGARFQVSLPSPVGGCAAFFDQLNDRKLVCSAYEDAMIREVEEICRGVPHEDLAIQWDICVEVLEIAAAEQMQTADGGEGSVSLLPGDPWTRAIAQFKRISAAVPPGGDAWLPLLLRGSGSSPPDRTRRPRAIGPYGESSGLPLSSAGQLASYAGTDKSRRRRIFCAIARALEPRRYGLSRAHSYL